MKRFALYLIAFLLFCTRAIAVGENDAKLNQAIKNLNYLKEVNSRNEKNGESHKNIYFFNSSPDFYDYIEEHNVDKNNKIFGLADFDPELLKDLNEQISELHDAEHFIADFYVYLDGLRVGDLAIDEVEDQLDPWTFSVAELNKYHSLKKFSQQLYDNSELGQREQNNGALFVVSKILHYNKTEDSESAFFLYVKQLVLGEKFLGANEYISSEIQTAFNGTPPKFNNDHNNALRAYTESCIKVFKSYESQKENGVSDDCLDLYAKTKNDPNAKGHEFTQDGNYYHDIVEKYPCILKNLEEIKIPDYLVEESDGYHHIKEERLVNLTQKEREGPRGYDFMVNEFAGKVKELSNSNADFYFSNVLTDKSNDLSSFNQFTEYWNDKLYAYYKSFEGKRKILVVHQELPFYLAREEWNDFAGKVAEAAGIDLSKNIVVIVPAYRTLKFLKSGETLKGKDVAYHMPVILGSYANQNIVVDKNVSFGSFLKSFYEAQKKPATIYTYVLKIDGSIDLLQVITQAPIEGLPYIYKIILLEDKQIKLADSYYECQRELAINNGNEFRQNEIKKKYINDVTAYHKIALGRTRELSDYQIYDEGVISNLKESYIPDVHEQFVNNIIYDEYNGLRYPLERADYGEGEALWDFDDPFLEAIDILGFITSPFGIDVVFDVAGASYCLVKGNVECFAMYGTGVAFVGISAAAVKYTGDNAMAILKGLGKLDASLTIESRLAKTFEVTTAEIASFSRLEGGRSLLNNPEFITRLSLVEPSVSSKLYHDLATPEFAELRSLYHENPEIINAYLIVHSDVDGSIRTSVEDLKKVSRYLDEMGEEDIFELADEFSSATNKRKWLDDLTAGGTDGKSIDELLSSLRQKVADRGDDFDWDAFYDDFGQNAELLTKFDENPGLVNCWNILRKNGRTDLKVDIPSLEALNKIRKHSRLTELGLTDDMLGRIQGIDNVSYAQMLDEVEKAMDALPAGKVKGFSKIIQNGEKRGLINIDPTNGIYDRRHSWLTLKVIQDNSDFLKKADAIEFEAVLETIDGVPQSVPDIKVTISEGGFTTVKIGEVYAGTGGAKSNLASQSLTYFNAVSDIRDLRFFRRMNVADKAVAKSAVIDSWKKGGVLDNDQVFNLFRKYDDEVTQTFSLFDESQLLNYLENNSEWFDTMFNSSF